MAANVINRYRFSTGEKMLTFYATKDDLLAVQVDNKGDIDVEGVFLTKSNPVIEEALSQVRAVLEGQAKKVELDFKNNSKEYNKRINDALK